MHVGLYLAPQTSGPEEDISNIEAVVEQALEADEAGFSTVYLTEHHLDDYNSYGDSHLLGAHLVGQLKNAWLASSVTLVTLHHPLRMVQQFNLLDVLSKGRVIFGLAGGGGPFMYEGMGRDPALRPAALDATIDAMLQIWAHQPGTPTHFETPYDHGTITGRVMPAPYHKPHPYLARGTNSAETMAKYAKLGWPVMVGRLPPERMGETTRFYRSELVAAG
jgi:alkanesulfonate monooxygenase SsuD/methylene tetrahydromethanopterin reductase-like flavin-dependent oxidoreductase (luciferase family)